jgi:signal transduction histidine kinase
MNVSEEETALEPGSTGISVGAVLAAVTTHTFVFDRAQRLVSATRHALDKTGPISTLAELFDSSLTASIPAHEKRLSMQKASDIIEAGSFQVGQGVWVWTNPQSELESGLVYAILRPLYSPASAISGLLFICDELSEGTMPESLAKDYATPNQEQGRIELARQFAVTLNHEINNPLFVVSATLEDLLAEPLDPQVAEQLQLALDSVWKVAEAVKLLQEIRQIVSKAYIPGYRMIDLEASSHAPRT